MSKLKYTRAELLALRDSNTDRPAGMPHIPGITSSFSQAPLVKTTFQPAPPSASMAATENSKPEKTSTNSYTKTA